MRRAYVILVLWLIVLTGAVVTNRELLFRMHWLLFTILILSLAWAWSNTYGVQITRQTRARRAQVGQVAEERFIVRNTGFLPKLWLEVWDGSNLPDHWASRVLNSLGPKRQRGWTVRTYCRRRGRFTLGPMTLASGDPLGLFRIERQIPATSTMIVYPATIDLSGFEPPIGRLSGGDVMRRNAHYVTTNVAGVRQYAPGDSFNRIHWPSSARTGELMVKQFEMDPTADVWLVLDMEYAVQVGTAPEVLVNTAGPAALWTSGLKFHIDPTTEEYGVTLTASLARFFLAQNRSVGLITYGQEREMVQLDRGERQAAKILETLAVIRAQGRASLEQVLAAESRSFGRNTTVIIITASTDDQWVNAVRDLKRRGGRSVVILLEAETFGPADNSLEVVSSLAANLIPTYLVKCGEPIEASLKQQVTL